jgi:hypothetical protein
LRSQEEKGDPPQKKFDTAAICFFCVFKRIEIEAIVNLKAAKSPTITGLTIFQDRLQTGGR